MTDKWDTPSHVMNQLGRDKPPGWVLAGIIVVAVLIAAALGCLAWNFL